MSSLNTTLANIFSGRTRNGSTGYTCSDEYPNSMYLEIPVNSNIFEVPCVVDSSISLLQMLNTGIEAIVVQLCTKNRVPAFTTIGAYMKEVLQDKFAYNRLVKLTTFDKLNTPQYYYATIGSIFDASYKPLLMCSWLVEKNVNALNNTEIKYIKPIVRIDPQCYLRKNNPIEKFIANTFIRTVLTSQKVTRPQANLVNIEVEIAESPFRLKKTETPSISTTNEELLKIALDNIDTILQ